MGIGKRISFILEKKKLTPSDLASKLNVTPSTIYSMISRDSSRIDIDLLIEIAHALGMTADELLGINTTASSSRIASDFDKLNEEGKAYIEDQMDYALSRDKFVSNLEDVKKEEAPQIKDA